jgi:hypothetical protein
VDEGHNQFGDFTMTEFCSRCEKYREEKLERIIRDHVEPRAVSPAAATILARELLYKAEMDDNDVVTVRMQVVENGQEIWRDVSPAEAVALMDENVADWGTLFKSRAASGVGGKGCSMAQRKAGL